VHFYRTTSIVPFIICAILLFSSCTWTTLRPHLIISSVSDLQDAGHLPIESEVFDQEMHNITGRYRHANNQLLLLKNGDEIFPILLELITKAKKSIYINQYAFHGDDVGIKISNALKERADEGVEICITYDYLGSRGTSRSFWEDLEQHNIEVRPFNPIPWWTVIRANNRDHRKIILIDREIGLIGDFGIGNHYAGDGNSNGSWRVSALLIKGPAIKDLEEVFLESWEEAGHGFINKDLPFPLINIILDIPFSLFPGPQAAAETEPLHSLSLKASGEVRIISSTPNWGSTEIFDAFLLAFKAARKSIYITQSYFIPNGRVQDALIDASRRGVEVKIILPQKPDVLLVKSAAELSYEELLEGGIRIFERKGTMLHTKNIVIDGIWSSIGSCNIDDRSFLLNYECNAVVYGRFFGNAMEEMFEEDLVDCEEIALERWRKRSWWKRLRNKLLIPFTKQL